MNFILLLKSGTTTESLLVNAPSWSDCLNYAENTGKQVTSMSLFGADYLIIDSSTNTLFSIGLIDNITDGKSIKLLFNTDISSAISWANSQTNKTLSSITSQKITYVAL